MAGQFTSGVALSLSFRIFMTSLLWGFPIYGQTSDSTTDSNGLLAKKKKKERQDVRDENSRKASSDRNGTIYHDPCEGICDKSQPVGVFIGTFIGGAIVGALVAIVVIRCFYKKNFTPEPKDRDDMHQVRFDVNRNNDHLASHEDEIVMEDPVINGHKKLERLVKPPVSPKPGNFGGIATAATPLIHSTDSSSLDDSTITSPSTTTATNITNVSPSNSESKSPKPSIALKPPPSPKFRKDPSEKVVAKLDDDDPAHTYEVPDSVTVDYTNVGRNSPLTQPYDTLQIIAEEVEYTNQPTHIYETFKNKSKV